MRDGFGGRVGSQVRTMSKVGPVVGDDWWMLSEEYLDYLGALSAEVTDLGIPEAQAVLRDATESAVGKVAYATLLPLLPLALAALAYRREGWHLPFETDYLPRALVTGFESAGPRVQAYGPERRPDAAAELSSGPVTVVRPENPRPLDTDSEAVLERDAQALLDPARDEPASANKLSRDMNRQVLLFTFRATRGVDVSDQQLRHLQLASRFGAATFQTSRAEGVYDSHYTGATRWLTAVNLTLITGVREDLTPLVLTDLSLIADGSVFTPYHRALHDYLRAQDARPAMDRALVRYDDAVRQGLLPPPAILLSQLVEGDEESFNLALLDALETHRDHYRVADRADDPDAAISLDILALNCHARRRGWAVRVSSPYLPPRLLEAAQSF
ncbi:hypothetical protein GCM10018785_38760 [Streptomyces longispororuber]|uniref:Uncharacterized protein n=1 Tax=Streptomyces longispororuber TaxID=68230 RepID=A0A918ZSG3_9ACTN|nr:hypothetical protein GCM10018785_38760 [Streptomyces longispororuber]